MNEPKEAVLAEMSVVLPNELNEASKAENPKTEIYVKAVYEIKIK